MEIRDPIHGNIEINETVDRIIDTPEMQRLRYLKQLDMSYLVFPGANHTRFEHSLGTMQVTRELLSNLYGRENEYMYAGLLHDIGHGPLSHLSEGIIGRLMKKDHEQLGEERIRSSEIKDIISDAGLSFSRVMSYFKARSGADIVSGTLGSDRIDYLMRDSHYTGVAYGVIDYERIKGSITMHKGKVALMERGVAGAESMLIARYFMHSNVYTHHAKLIASKMLQYSASAAIENGDFGVEEFAQMDDGQFLSRVIASKRPSACRIASRVMERNLFKRAFYGSADISGVEEIENAVMKLGLKRDEFIAHVVRLGGVSDDIMVVGKDGDELGRLSKLSPFIGTLSGVLKGSNRLVVACDGKNIGKVRAAVLKAL